MKVRDSFHSGGGRNIIGVVKVLVGNRAPAIVFKSMVPKPAVDLCGDIFQLLLSALILARRVVPLKEIMLSRLADRIVPRSKGPDVCDRGPEENLIIHDGRKRAATESKSNDRPRCPISNKGSLVRVYAS